MNDEYFKKLQSYKQYGKPVEPKKVYRIPKKSAKKIEEEKAIKQSGLTKPPTKLELDKWFDDIRIKHCGNSGGTHCWECGTWIPEAFMRHATAHLLAKKLFESVRTHELNYLILCAGNGCHSKSDRLDKFVQMRTWPEAARRMKILIPLLPIDELRHISSQLLTALDNTFP